MGDEGIISVLMYWKSVVTADDTARFLMRIKSKGIVQAGDKGTKRSPVYVTCGWLGTPLLADKSQCCREQVARCDNMDTLTIRLEPTVYRRTDEGTRRHNDLLSTKVLRCNGRTCC